MEKILFNSNNEHYPIVLIPEKILDFQHKILDNREIAKFLNIKYPVLNLNIYYKSEHPESTFKSDSKSVAYYNIICKDYADSYVRKISTIDGFKTYKTLCFYIDNEAEYLNPKNEKYTQKYFIEKYELPVKPSKFNKIRKRNQGCIIFIIIFFSLTLFLAFAFKISIALVFFSIVMFILLMISKELEVEKTYEIPIDEDVFNSNFENFTKEIEKIKLQVKNDYNTDKIKFENLIIEKRIEIEQKILIDNLEPYDSITKLSASNKRGRTELLFFTKLFKHFTTQINIDVVPNIGKNPFQPDFVLICKKTGFHIDIEVDEPYAVDNGKPIHHDRSNDEERNDYFLELNWGVIRFTEKQVIENTNDCIALIENVLSEIHNKSNTFNHNLPLIKKWTYEESIVMSNTNYRNNYLPDNLKVNINYKNNDQKYEEFNSDDLPF
jgi:hypothetical protein